jgi:NADPH:quinone reductase-like Zn-dependent oxidoreductase
MRQLKLIAHGEPSEVIELNTVAEPALGQEDVLISMEAAPINPSDFCSSVASTASGPLSHPR